MKHQLLRSAIATILAVVVASDVLGTEIGMTNNNTNESNSTALSEGVFNNNSGGSVSQNFEAATPIPYLPGAISPVASSPTLFSIQGLPAQVAGLPLLSKNYFPASLHDVAIGSSGGTKIIYNGATLPNRPERKERNITMNFSGLAEGELVGSITIQSRKNKADEVDVATLMYDAAQYVNTLKELKGYNIILLTMKNTMTYALGVDARSSGFSLSPLVSGLINGPTGVIAGLASGFSKAGGVTVPTALVGCTFLILVDGNNSRLINLTSNYNIQENSETNGNGTLRKKYEAVKEE